MKRHAASGGSNTVTIICFIQSCSQALRRRARAHFRNQQVSKPVFVQDLNISEMTVESGTPE